MKVVRTRAEFFAARSALGGLIGLVPTMGACTPGTPAARPRGRRRRRRRRTPSTLCSSGRTRTSPATHASSRPISRSAATGGWTWCGRRGRGHVSARRLAHQRAAGRTRFHTRRYVVARVFHRRAHGGREVLPSRAAGTSLFRREGLPAARPHPADDRGPRRRGRRHRRADGARAGRARAVEPQRLPSPDDRERALVLSRALFAGRAAQPHGALAVITEATAELATSRASTSTTSNCGRPISARSPNTARRGCWSRPASGRCDASTTWGSNSDGIALPRRLAAPHPGWEVETDVAVVGSGIAGLTTALHISRQSSLRVLLVTKDVLAAGSTRWAQGGIAAALGAGTPPTTTSATRSSPGPACATRRRCGRWCARVRLRCASSADGGALRPRARRRAVPDPRGWPPSRPHRARRRRRHRSRDRAGTRDPRARRHRRRGHRARPAAGPAARRRRIGVRADAARHG